MTLKKNPAIRNGRTVKKMTDLFAHSENRYNRKHPVKEHLTEVAKQTKEYAGEASWAQEALLAGILHDLGKYADLFQARLRGEESGLDHWSPGAWVALTKFHAVAASLAIQGHHIGLQRGNKESLSGMNPASLATRHPLNLRLSDPDPDNLVSRAEKDDLEIKYLDRDSINMLELYQNPVASMLDVRLLFSCLTDADFLDTEAHFEGNEYGKCYREKGPVLDAREELQALDLFMEKNIRPGSNADQNVTEVRNSLWKMMIKSAAKPGGLFTLTAPTPVRRGGLGKRCSCLVLQKQSSSLLKSHRRLEDD